MKVRAAMRRDLKRITEIYNEAIINSVATCDTEPQTVESRLAWFQNHGQKFIIFVVEDNNDVKAWSSLSKWSDRGAYASTAEISIYVDKRYRRKGIGKLIMEQTLDHARTNTDLHTIIAKITGENEFSVQFHKKYGFDFIGTMKEAGYKFNRYIDIHLYQLLLD